LKYKGHERTIQTFAWWCDNCKDGILAGEPLAEHERAWLELKAEVDGAPDRSPTVVRIPDK